MNPEEREYVDYETPVEGGVPVGEGGYEIVPVTEQAPQFEVTPKGGGAAEKAGIATRKLLEGLSAGLGGVGAKLENPTPPTDDLSDLFEGPDMDKDNDVYIKDLVTVDEQDAMGDGDPEMRDLLEVSDEDIMGEEESPTEMHPVQKTQRKRFFVRKAPPSGLSGVR